MFFFLILHKICNFQKDWFTIIFLKIRALSEISTMLWCCYSLYIASDFITWNPWDEFCPNFQKITSYAIYLFPRFHNLNLWFGIFLTNCEFALLHGPYSELWNHDINFALTCIKGRLLRYIDSKDISNLNFSFFIFSAVLSSFRLKWHMHAQHECICTYMYTNAPTYSFAPTCLHEHECICTYMYTNAPTYSCAPTRLHKHLCMHTHTHLHIHTRALHTDMFIVAKIHVHKHVYPTPTLNTCMPTQSAYSFVIGNWMLIGISWESIRRMDICYRSIWCILKWMFFAARFTLLFLIFISVLHSRISNTML